MAAAGIITRSAHPSSLWPGIRDFFGGQYKEFEPEWSRIFNKKTSTKAYEKFVEQTGFGLAPSKSEGSPIQYDTDSEGYTSTITPTVYALGYIVTREELDDNQYVEKSMSRSEALARSMRTTAEMVHANVLNRGFDGAYPTGDGVPLFSASHPTPGGLQSNLLTAADFSEAALEDAAKVAWRLKNARGLPINARVTKLVINPEDAFLATRVLDSANRVGTANNDINAVRAMGIVQEVIVNHYLTDTDSWYLLTDAAKSLVSIWRNEVELEKDSDFDTENAKAKARMRFGAGSTDWRGILGNPGA